MNISVCVRSFVAGAALAVLFTGSAWYGSNLYFNAQITQAIIAQAKCDQNGTSHVSMILPDGSEFMCTPRQFIPDSRQEAAKRPKR
jgi:hypothetical protein